MGRKHSGSQESTEEENSKRISAASRGNEPALQQLSAAMLLPKPVMHIIDLFEADGYEIFAVGGCVRDQLLGREIHDWDLCTSAQPQEMLTLCERAGIQCIPTGIKHGTVTLMQDSIAYEVTTYRVEGKYSDGRHPDRIAFTNVLKRDLARRDFTINALAYNDKTGIVDYYSGLMDLKSGLIKCVGNAEKRFREDQLRKLRAIRFAAQLNFNLEEETLRQLYRDPEGIRMVSIERIREEFVKLLVSEHVSKGLELLFSSGLWWNMLPAPTGKQNNRVFIEGGGLWRRIGQMPAELTIRLVVLLYDRFLAIEGEGLPSGLKAVEELLRYWKFDLRTIGNVMSILPYAHWDFCGATDADMKRLIQGIGTERLSHFFEFKKCLVEESPDNRAIQQLAAVQKRCGSIVESNEPIWIKDLAVNGNDLLQWGCAPGKSIKEALNALLELVLEQPEKNTKEQLLEEFNKLIQPLNSLSKP